MALLRIRPQQVYSRQGGYTQTRLDQVSNTR